MKKLILTAVAVMTIASTAMAQGGGNFQRNMDPTEMAKRQAEMAKTQTENMVKQYGLDEGQAAKLMELNKKYAGKRGFGMMGRGGRGMGQRPRANFGGQGGGQFGGGQMPEMSEEMRQRMAEMRKQMQETQEAYNAELKQILTEEQFKAYTADQEKRMNEQRGRRGGSRNNGNN
jgi:hypothetical protein